MHASLLTRYNRPPPLTPLLQFGVLRDTASGLSYIHSQRIVHRDLTPKNVLVTKDGRAKVADVGVARSLHGDRLGEAMTQAPGTILYMPPEAPVTQPVYDERLDVFSYGVLMMSVILKREPPGDLLFSRRDEFGPDGRVHMIPEAVRRAKDLRDIGRDHRLFGAINRCLENAPARRPSSSELFEELERLYRREEIATATESEFDFQAASVIVSGEELTICQAERDRLLREKEDLSRLRDDALQQQREVASRSAGMFRLLGQRMRVPLAFDLKWNSVNSLESLGSGKNKEIVQLFLYRSCLFAYILLNGDGHLYQTRNVQDWHEVDIDWFLPRQDNRICKYSLNKFLVHKDQLYNPSSHFFSKENLTEIALVQLLFIDERYSSAKLEFVGESHWKLEHHPDSFMYTSFSVGDSIVLSGEMNRGFTRSFPTVIEFNMKTKQWVKNSRWTNLPEPVSKSTAIMTCDKVHLICGVIGQPGSPTLIAVSKVFTMDLMGSQQVGTWHTDDIPETPHARSGAVL